MEVDHDRQLVFCETLCVSSLTALSAGGGNGGNGGACGGNGNGNGGLGLLGATQPSDEQVAARLSAPVVTTQLDTRNIAFERSDNTDAGRGEWYKSQSRCAGNLAETHRIIYEKSRP